MKYAQGLLGLVFLWVFTSAVMAAENSRPAVQVSGEGEVEIIPDTALLSYSVSRTAASMSEAKAEVDKVVAKLLRAARSAGVKEGDLNASRVYAQPDYEWVKGKRHLRGQRVERKVSLRLLDLDRYSELVDAVLDAGISNTGQTQFVSSRLEELERMALVAAVKNARAKAKAMAKALGEDLGSVLAINEHGGGHRPQPEMMMARMADAGMEKAAPMVVGKQTIRRRVSVSFALED